MPLQTVAVSLVHLLGVDSSMLVLANHSPLFASTLVGTHADMFRYVSSRGSWLSTGVQCPMGQGG
jgi:hypothetical protein